MMLILRSQGYLFLAFFAAIIGTFHTANALRRVNSHGTLLSELRPTRVKKIKKKDPLVEFSEKISRVARLSNGISLITGLTSGKIPIDDVIGELANFGAAKVENVLKLEKSNVDRAIGELAAAASKIPNSAEIIKVEQQVGDVHKIREDYKRVTNFSAFSEKPFFDQINTLLTNLTIRNPLLVFENTYKIVNASMVLVNSIEGVTEVKANNYYSTAGHFNNLITELGKIQANLASNKLMIAASGLQVLDKLIHAENVLNPIIQVLAILEFHKNNPTKMRSDQFNTIRKNVDAVISLATSLNSIQTDLETIDNLVFSRTKPTVMSRRFTLAFSDGAADLKRVVDDVKDPAVQSSIGDGRNVTELSLALKPLLTMSAKLETLVKTLKPMATSGVSKAFDALRPLWTLLSGFTMAPSETLAVLNEFNVCNFSVMNTTLAAELSTLLGNAINVSSRINSTQSFAHSITLTVADLTALSNSLTTTNPTEDSVRATLNDFRNGSVSSVVKKLKELHMNFSSFPNFEETLNTARAIQKADGVIKKFKSAVRRQLDGLECYKNSSGSIENLLRGVQAAAIIRRFKSPEIVNVKVAIEAVTEASEPIKALQKIPMKLVITGAETHAKESFANAADIISQSASSTRNMERLLNIRSVFKGLQNDKAFRSEVVKVTDFRIRSELEQKWKDYPLFLTTLNATIWQIEAFRSDVKSSQNLRALGDFIDKTAKVRRVRGNITEKIEAVTMLIALSTDKSAQTALTVAKEKLESLAALDLNFATYRTSFPQLPSALDIVFSFFANFFSSPAAPTEMPTTSTEGSASIGLLIALIIVVIIIILVLGFVAFKVLKRQRAESVKKWSRIAARMDRLLFVHQRDAIDHHQNIFYCTKQPSKLDAAELPKKYKKWARYNNPLREETRVKMSGDWWYHANEVELRNGQKYMATDAPMDGVYPYGKMDNRPRFWQLIFARKCEYVVKLCLDNEQSLNMCAPYFPALGGKEQFGDYTVETTSEKTDTNGIITRILLVTCGSKSRTVHHLQCTQWPDHGAPENPDAVVEMLKTVRPSKQPILIHCSAGDGRTMTMIGIIMATLDLERSPDTFSLSDIVMRLRRTRTVGIQGIVQTYFLQIAAFKLVCDSQGIEGAQYFQKHIESYLENRIEFEVVQKARGTPIDNDVIAMPEETEPETMPM